MFEATLSRATRLHVVSYTITDDYVRTYWDTAAAEAREPLVYINPKHATVTINPDSGAWAVVLSGPIVGVPTKSAEISYRGEDWVYLMTPQASLPRDGQRTILPLVIQVVRAAAREMMPGDAEFWSEA